MFPRYEPTLTQDCRALEHIVKLSDVARPLVPQQHLPRLWRETRGRAPRRSVEFLEECIGQKRDVTTALAQGRNADIEDLQPVKQVLPEAAVRDRPLQVTVARGNHADIGFDGPRATESLKLPLLQDTKQLRLGRAAHFAHFVEEQDPRGGQLDLAGFRPMGPRECATFVPK